MAGAVSSLLQCGRSLKVEAGAQRTCMYFTASKAEAPPPLTVLSLGQKEDFIPLQMETLRPGKVGRGVPEPTYREVQAPIPSSCVGRINPPPSAPNALTLRKALLQGSQQSGGIVTPSFPLGKPRFRELSQIVAEPGL